MKLGRDFFSRDCLEVAPELVGKIIARKLSDGTVIRVRITETEAYRGEEDKACHASKGRTPRTELLYGESGVIYVYLCYGMHWLMNVITGEKDIPQGVLIRAGEGYNGPAKLTKRLMINKEQNGTYIYDNDRDCRTMTSAIWCAPVLRLRQKMNWIFPKSGCALRCLKHFCADLFPAPVNF